MKNLLEFLLIHIVEHPEDVKIEENKKGETIEYLLSVHPDDVGRIIGKGGSVIQAIRSIAKIRAVKEGIRVNVSVGE